MLTNEQILTILNTWNIKGAYINNNEVIELYLFRGDYAVTFNISTSIMGNKILYLTLFKKIEKIEYPARTTELRLNINDDLKVEVEYLVTKKAKEHLKSKIDDIFNPVLEGLDGLV